MNDYKFEQLERTLYHALKNLRHLQKKYRKQTGQDFVSTVPLPTPDRPEGWNPCKNNQGCFLPHS